MSPFVPNQPIEPFFLAAKRLWLTLLIACLAVFGGCVRRRLIVRTNPPGASVYVDKQLIGTTPASSAFTYYGTREIEVVADGFRTEKVLRTFSPTWYQIPPLDFISETLWPWELRDERIVDVSLVPDQPVASEVLQARADNLRLQAAQGIATPLIPAVPSPGAIGGSLGPQPTILPPTVPPGFDSNLPTQHHPGFHPVQALKNFFRPGGQLPQSFPEAGVLPGGGYRLELPEP